LVYWQVDLGIPTFIFTDSEVENILKGSARSAAGVHLKELLDKCSEVLYKYGGHKEAAGVSVELDKYDEMRMLFMDRIGEPEEVIDTDIVYYDLEIDISEVENVIKTLEKYAPFGQGNPEIRFLIKGFELSPRYSSFYKTMGGDNEHLKLFGIGMEAVGFGMTQHYIDLHEPKTLNLIGTLGTNYFMGKTATQITLSDFDSAEKRIEKSKLASLLASRAKERYS
jgi:single-stranded-DNA-specific exonuclease